MVVKFPSKSAIRQLKRITMQYNVTNTSYRYILNVIKLAYKHYKLTFLQKSPFAWYCIKCFEDIIPFSTISDNEIYQSNKGKKIKFKVLTKKNILTKHDLVDKLNNSMGVPESEMLYNKYYEPNEMTALFKNTNTHFSFFHLNILSLPFHFEELSTLITKHNLSFDFLGI